jgi:hypothetical protein
LPCAFICHTQREFAPDRKEWFVVKRILAAFAVFGLVLVTPALASATVRSHAATSTSRYFGKGLVSELTTSAGVPLGQNAEPAVGDRAMQLGDLYRGSHTHYGKSVAGSYMLNCTFTTVTQSAAIGSCIGAIAIGNSLLISNVTQNFASQAAISVYPITGGTGTFKGVSGRVVTYAIGTTSNSDFVLQIANA